MAVDIQKLENDLAPYGKVELISCGENNFRCDMLDVNYTDLVTIVTIIKNNINSDYPICYEFIFGSTNYLKVLYLKTLSADEAATDVAVSAS